MNSCSGSGSAVVVSNCYQLAWILAVSRVVSEVCDSRRRLKFKLDHSPLFSSAKLKMAIAAVKAVIWISLQNWWERSCCLNSNAWLTCLLLWILWRYVLDFSEQAFILETVMRTYSRRLDFLELNPYVDYSSHIITKKKKTNNLEFRRIKWWPNNGTTTFMGGAVVIPVIMEILTDS